MCLLLYPLMAFRNLVWFPEDHDVLVHSRALPWREEHVQSWLECERWLGTYGTLLFNPHLR